MAVTTSATTTLSLPTRRSATRPSCTHIRMDRVYGTDLQCFNCGRVPTSNFIYCCIVDTHDPAFSGFKPRQSIVVPSVRERSLSPPTSTFNKRRRLQKNPSREPSPRTPDMMVHQMRMLGFNNSVMSAAEAGQYTAEQLITLINQKKQVKASIDTTLGDDRSRNGSEAAIIAEKLRAYGVPESKLEKSISSNIRSRASARAVQPCEFKVCHNCRPFSRDRSFTAFETIINDEVCLPPMHIPQLMPVQLVSICRNIGLKPVPHQKDLIHNASNIDLETLESDLDAASDSSLSSSSSEADMAALHMRTGRADSARFLADPTLPTERLQRLRLNVDGPSDADPVKLNTVKPKRSILSTEHLIQHGAKLVAKASTSGFHNSLIRDLQNLILRAHKQAAISPTGCDYRTGLTKELAEKLLAIYAKTHGQVFDVDLWRAMNLALIKEASDTPLPSESEDELRHFFHGNGKGDQSQIWSTTGAGADGGYIHPSSPKEADRVKGGLAVTEEAVETRTPDLITAI